MGYSFSISSEAIPNAIVLGYRGTEAISRPYAFQIGLRVVGEVRDLAEVVHEPMVLETSGPQGIQRICGIVSSAKIVHVDPHGALVRLELVPTLWRAGLSRHSRIFTDASIPDILKAVLAEEDIPELELRLVESYPKREHVGQYKESNLAFISRLMEREGIFYFFEHEGDREKLIIADSNSAFGPSRTIPVGYTPRQDGVPEIGETFFALSMKRTALPRSVQLTDWNYRTPAVKLDAARDVAKTTKSVIVHHGDHLVDPDEIARRTRIRVEELRVGETLYRASGPVSMLLTGSSFTVDGHPRASMNGDLVALTIDHVGARIESIDDVAWRVLDLPRDISYRATVTGIRPGVPFRAQRLTPRPRIEGVVDGVVDGAAASTYAQIDDQGRYKLRLSFDEGDPIDGSTSTWVRMAQPHGGGVEGFHFPLRKRTEVHVAFDYGDPDRPLIVGVAHNVEKPSVVTAANHTQNVIMTGGSNRIEIEDLAGLQRIDVSCPTLDSFMHLGAGIYQFDVNTEGEGWIYTGADHEITVDGHKTEDVLGSVFETYKSSQTFTIDRAVTEMMKTSRTTTVDGPEVNTWKGPLTETVTLAVEERYVTGLETIVSGAVTLTYNVGEKLTVTGGATETYLANQDTGVTGTLTHTVTGTVQETLKSSSSRTVGTAYDLQVDGAMTVRCNKLDGDIGNWGTADGATKNRIENLVDEILGKQIKVTGFKATAIGYRNRNIMFDISATGIAIGIAGVSFSATPVKIEKIGPKLHTTVPELKLRGANMLIKTLMLVV